MKKVNIEIRKAKRETVRASHLLLCKVKLAQLLPELTVLTEHVQRGRGLAQVDDVPGVGELVEDPVLHVQREVAEGHIAGYLLGEIRGRMHLVREPWADRDRLIHVSGACRRSTVVTEHHVPSLS